MPGNGNNEQADEAEGKRAVTWESVLPEATLPSPLMGAAPGVLGADAAAMDGEAFGGFYNRSARPLWAYLARVSGDRSLADDLMQESFVRFLCAERAPRLEDGEVARRRYLFRIATNLLRDHWRKPPATSVEEVPEEFLASPLDASERDSAALLAPALNRMRPRERQLLWLAYAEGYSHKEIAEITGLASAGIRLLLFRARHKIAKLLRERDTQQSVAVPRRLP